MVAQVDEQHAAVVADAMAPAGQPHLLADVALAKRAAGVGAVAVHDWLRLECGGKAREKRMRGSALSRRAGPRQAGRDLHTRARRNTNDKGPKEASTPRGNAEQTA